VAALSAQSGALTLAGGVLAALFARERTGKGQRVDASIFGTMIAAQGFEINYAAMTGEEPERAGRGHPFLHGVWGAFRTSDGHICLAGVDDKRWSDFCRIMGIQHVEQDPECADNPTRNFHGSKIEAILDGIFPQKSTREWLQELTAADILATEVLTYKQVLASEQARMNGYVMNLDHPAAGKISVTGCPVSLGYTWEEIAALRDAEAV
jgi:CoA:oxalate CoA-transferase